MVTAPTPKSALKAKALRLLTQREYSRSELQTKLRAFVAARPATQEDDDEAHEHLIDTVLNELEQAAWVSDTRTAEAVVHSRQQRGLGVRRITQELTRKGIDPATIATATENLHSTEAERALALLQKRKPKSQNDSDDAFDDNKINQRERHKEHQKEWQKNYQFLIRRGFSSAIAQRALAQWDHQKE